MRRRASALCVLRLLPGDPAQSVGVGSTGQIIGGGSHGLWKRCTALAAGRSAADHSASGAVLAPLESSLVQPLRPFWWARARSIGQRKVRHQLRARDCADDVRLRQGGRDQRHVRDRIHQGCQAEGRCARETLRTGDVDRSHQDQQRCEGRRDQRQRQGRVADGDRQLQSEQAEQGFLGQGSYQVSAHKDAVSLFERYAKDGDSADLKDWAGKTLPTLKPHLATAQEFGKAPSVGQSNRLSAL
jgi:uncharacterized protein DUF4142